MQYQIIINLEFFQSRHPDWSKKSYGERDAIIRALMETVDTNLREGKNIYSIGDSIKIIPLDTKLGKPRIVRSLAKAFKN